MVLTLLLSVILGVRKRNVGGSRARRGGTRTTGPHALPPFFLPGVVLFVGGGRPGRTSPGSLTGDDLVPEQRVETFTSGFVRARGRDRVPRGSLVERDDPSSLGHLARSTRRTPRSRLFMLSRTCHADAARTGALEDDAGPFVSPPRLCPASDRRGGRKRRDRRADTAPERHRIGAGRLGRRGPSLALPEREVGEPFFPSVTTGIGGGGLGRRKTGERESVGIPLGLL